MVRTLHSDSAVVVGVDVGLVVEVGALELVAEEVEVEPTGVEEVGASNVVVVEARDVVDDVSTRDEVVEGGATAARRSPT
jgi:hypothetical protein